jgi:DHA2 family multidrug resistance protein-like MFS transporter
VATAKASLAGALNVASSLPTGPARELATAARSAWMSGLSTAMVLGALIIVAAAVIARLGLPAETAIDEVDADVESIDEALAAVAA